MATTVHEPPQAGPRRVPDHGNGGGGNLVPADGDRRLAVDYSPPPSSTAIWVVLFAISMMFAAFTSALVVRKGSSLDWRSFSLPSILFFNTLVLFASSVTLEFARRRIAAFMGNWRTFCRWSIYCVVAVEGRGPLSGDQSKQFLFLCADSHACVACAGGTRRACLCDSQAG